MREASRAVKRLRALHPFNGSTFPYVVVPEQHRDGHWHLHLALDRFVPDRVIAEAWGHGYIDARRIESKRGGRDAARQAAHYLTKYLAKTFELDGSRGRLFGRHRYEVGEGYQPETVRRAGFRSRHEALDWLADDYLLEIEHAVWSEDVDADGVPWVWATVEMPR